MKYKLLAIDLDDTLLNEQFKISRRNREAIRKIVSTGLMVTIATGRMFRSALPYARELGVELPLITYHGALIKKTNGEETLRHCPVPYDLALEILLLGEEEGFHLNLYLDDALFIKEENENSRYYQTIASIPLEAVGDLYQFLLEKKAEPTKLTVINFAGRLREIQMMLEEKYREHLSILQSRPYFLEITNRGATKGQALKFLAEREGILPGEVVAVGDSYNDIDMLQFAGLGVAVANAPQEVKDVANYVTRTNTEDGVAFLIEELLLP